MTAKIGIVGATGYTGSELIRLLASRSDVSLEYLGSRSADGVRADEVFPALRGTTNLTFEGIGLSRLSALNLVFFATPHGVAMSMAPELLKAGVKVVDLGADFRIQDTQIFAQWYSMPHSSPEALKTAVYGLTEVNREQVKQAQLIANPGCYPTTVLLGLCPLVKSGAELEEQVIVDAKSGVSGAGKKASEALLFAELSDNFKAYGLPGHRHQPEIEQELAALGLKSTILRFTPHLLPMVRGMFSTIYVTLKNPALDVQSLYEQFYLSETFVDVLPKGVLPETKSVRGSNRLRIAIEQNGSLVRLLVVQDNLVKGAAGQAVQNMNLMLGLEETAGLLAPGLSA